ncbi:hypothetical protein CPB97_009365 [Podila verticillata]|nr:hypothetical protein CPB97_009365 [Podila verticillata]
MTPEELAALFKRRGDFDDTRKNLLSDFQNSTVGQQFTHQLSDILQSCIDEDPSLLQRERSEFHQLMVDRITKSTEYKKVQQFVDSLLQPAQYMSKIESTLMTIVKEQAPVEKEVAQDKDKDKESSSSSSSTAKRSHIHSSDSAKKDKGEKLEISGTSKIPDKRTRVPESLPAKPVQPSPSLPLDLSRKKDVDTDIDEDDKENVKAQNGSSKTPPSSSEPDSDADDRLAEGGRAKKVVKKANKDMDSTGEMDHGAFGNHSLDSIDTSSDLGVNSSMDIDPVASIKPEVTEGRDVDMATDQESQKPKLTELKDDNQLRPEPPTTDSITPKVDSPGETVKKEHPVSELSGDRPSTKDASQGSTSTSGTSSSKDNLKPTPPSSSHKKEPESDRARSHCDFKRNCYQPYSAFRIS